MSRINRKKAFLSVVAISFFCLGSIASAQELDFSAICSAIKSNPVMKGPFEQEKTVAATKRTLKSSGDFIISSEGIYWATKKPISSTLVITETRMIQTARNGKKTVSDMTKTPGFAGVFSIIRAVLQGDEEKIKESFSVDFKAEGVKWTADLTPSTETLQKAIEHISITGKGGSDALVTQILVEQTGGDSVLYKLSNTEVSQTLTDEEKAIFLE